MTLDDDGEPQERTDRKPLRVGVESSGGTGQAGRILADLREPGFVVLTGPGEADRPRFEAWAYQGPLDFDEASPIAFGIGPNTRAAMRALDEILGATPDPS
jgi:hypothetical protein